MQPLNLNAQAILLLTAPLVVGAAAKDQPAPLSLGEYNLIARFLRDRDKQPSILIEQPQFIAEVAAGVGERVTKDRLNALVDRGYFLSQAMDRWISKGVSVVTRADAAYPRKLKARLKDDAPPVLYAVGKLPLLDSGGLAVVGSRNVTEEVLRFSETVGALAARTGRAIISGAAKGVDRASMRGALAAGGVALGALSDSLERAAIASENREFFENGKLVCISACDPAAGFNVGNAMQRNKLIYALSNAALVVTSESEKGGTWAGATEQLKKYNFVPVYVRKDLSSAGNQALLRNGALPWPEVNEPKGLEKILSSRPASHAPPQKQADLDLAFNEAPHPYGEE